MKNIRLSAESARRVAAALAQLELDSPVLLEEIGSDPLDVLVATILSQAAGDKTTREIFRDLKIRYPRWEDLREAPVEELESLLRRGGLARQKALRIKALLAQLPAHPEGTPTLAPLLTGGDDEVMARLQGLGGVGPKTAACVLLFALNRPVFPVDTHVLRIAKRLGWVGTKENVARAQELLSQVIPSELQRPLHTALIRFGREFCRARRPKCAFCPLRVDCTYGQAKDIVNPGEPQASIGRAHEEKATGARGRTC